MKGVALALTVVLTAPLPAVEDLHEETWLTDSGIHPCALRYCSWYLSDIYDHLLDAMQRQDRADISCWSAALYDYLADHPEERPGNR